MKRSFIITLLCMAALNGCATIDKGLIIGLIESVVESSIVYLREHPDTIPVIRPIDAAISGAPDASLD